MTRVVHFFFLLFVDNNKKETTAGEDATKRHQSYFLANVIIIALSGVTLKPCKPSLAIAA